MSVYQVRDKLASKHYTNPGDLNRDLLFEIFISLHLLLSFVDTEFQVRLHAHLPIIFYPIPTLRLLGGGLLVVLFDISIGFFCYLIDLNLTQ